MNEQEGNGAAMPELYKKLLLRDLWSSGFSQAKYLPETGQIKIPLDGHEHPPLITASGSVLYHEEHRDLALDTLSPIAGRAKEIADAWNCSREMPVSDLPEFRMLAEYNNIVLAARDDTEHGHGLHFVTWEYNYERTGMYRGHYTEDYSYAKEDFAVRADLIPESKLIKPEQAAEIKASVEYRIKNDDHLTLAVEDILKDVTEKLERAYPAIGKSEKPQSGKKPSIGDKLREGKAKSDANKTQAPADKPKKRTKESD
jgi:hypothetical protein